MLVQLILFYVVPFNLIASKYPIQLYIISVLSLVAAYYLNFSVLKISLRLEFGKPHDLYALKK